MRTRLAVVAAALLALQSAAYANRATMDVVADRTAATPGGKVTLALTFTIEPGWHLYWINPGETGVPPKVKWRLPPGVTAGPLRFPVPHRIEAGELTAYGYENTLTLLTDLTIPADTTGTLTIAGDARWVVCADACVSETQSIALELPVGPGAASRPEQFKAWQLQQPDRTAVEPIAATLDAEGRRGALEVPAKPGRTAVEFFPPVTPFAVYEQPQFRPGQKVEENGIYRLPFRVLPGAPAEYSAVGLVVWRDAAGKTIAEERPFTFKFPSR
ncbi:MAG TPA: protein-disulfide reductase DsbD domain-containing protein [Tepidisphaeraceae bacterium]|jgi:DsbC/DsbD-like thiol-disulfide interchange protein